MSRKVAAAVALGLVSGLIALTVWRSGGIEHLERATWSHRVRLFAKPSPATDAIRIILLDQYSLDWAQREWSLPWPWPRSVYASIFEFLQAGGAKCLAMDVLFTEGSGEGHVSEDVQLGEGFTRLPSVSAVFLGQTVDQHKSWPTAVPRPVHGPSGLEPELALDAGAAFPVMEVATQATVLAHVREISDADGVFRRARLFRVFDHVPLPALGLAPLTIGTTTSRFHSNRFELGEYGVAVDPEQRVLLRFRGPSGTHRTYPAAAILQSAAQRAAGESPAVDPAAFKGAYVFFGFSAPGLKDLRPTPVSGDYPGVEVHATLLDNLLAGDALQDAPPLIFVAVTLLLGVIGSGAVLAGRHIRDTVIAFALLLPLPYLIALAAYPLGYWWPIAAGTLGMTLSLVSAVGWNYATEGRQKRFIRSAFNQYVGPEVLNQLVAHPERLRLGGEKRELTMFFSDLEKFSSFSEKLDPPRLIDLLNVYLTEAGAILTEEGAYVDKFVGDAIVAFWNAPVPQTDHAARALRSAIRCQRRCADLRAEWEARFGATIRMRIGINTGEVVVGNMGSRDKFNYTMLGDAANAASRLEGANKGFGTFSMVAESTWSAAGDAVWGRELGLITVVGRKAPLRVFEPMGLRGEARPDWLTEYERGVAHVRSKEWSAAYNCFAAIPADPVSQRYAERCKACRDSADTTWDGIWNLVEK